MTASDASRSPSALEMKQWEVAWNYVNACAGNKTASYLKWYDEHGEQRPVAPAPQANKFFKNEHVQELVEQFRAENRAEYANIRDENIAILREIASNPDNKKSDITAAIKELNSMCGYNAQNINLNGKVDSEIIVEIEGL